MASVLYRKFKEQILQHGDDTDLSSGTVKAVLVDTGTYTFSQTHQYLSSVTGIMQSGGSNCTLTIDNKSLTSGTFKTSDATDTFTSPDSGGSFEAMIVYVDSGSAATSPLVAYIELDPPVLPSGGTITVTWDASTVMNGVTGGIFAL